MSCGVLTFIFRGPFSPGLDGGAFSGGPMPPRRRGLICGLGTLCCPPVSLGVHACPLPSASVPLPWVAMPRGLCAAALPGGLSGSANSRRCRPAHGGGVFSGGPMPGASLWSGSLFRFRLAGPGAGSAALNAAIKIGFTSGRSDPRLLKWALMRGCKFRKEKPGLFSGCKIGSRFRRTSPRCHFSSRLTRALRGLFLPFNFEG